MSRLETSSSFLNWSGVFKCCHSMMTLTSILELPVGFDILELSLAGIDKSCNYICLILDSSLIGLLGLSWSVMAPL